MFWNKSPDKDVLIRLESLEADVRKLKKENLDLFSAVETIRNKVLRRFQTGKNDIPEEKTSEGINTFNPFGLS